jgi:hypothetical protein
MLTLTVLCTEASDKYVWSAEQGWRKRNERGAKREREEDGRA